MNFNTSNVKVQQRSLYVIVFSLQYFNTSNVKVQPCNSIPIGGMLNISIHPMWRFSIRWPLLVITELENFNTSNVKVQQGEGILLCFHYSDFNTSNVKVQQFFNIYNRSCYIDFNTSNVKVQLECTILPASGENISIHPMWRFSRLNRT